MKRPLLLPETHFPSVLSCNTGVLECESAARPEIALRKANTRLEHLLLFPIAVGFGHAGDLPCARLSF
jgi:hypothetical protein